jgi:hypothetical protein
MSARSSVIPPSRKLEKFVIETAASDNSLKKFPSHAIVSRGKMRLKFREQVLRLLRVRVYRRWRNGHLQATPRRDLGRVLQCIQRFDGRPYDVQHIGAAQTLGENIANASRLDHGTHPTAGNHTRCPAKLAS